jgi:DNA-binding MarR family transcriptional regulator
VRYRPTVSPTDEDEDSLTDEHMQLLEWLDAHPAGSLIAAVPELGLEAAGVEALFTDLVAAEMIERVRGH